MDDLFWFVVALTIVIGCALMLWRLVVAWWDADDAAGEPMSDLHAKDIVPIKSNDDGSRVFKGRESNIEYLMLAPGSGRIQRRVSVVDDDDDDDVIDTVRSLMSFPSVIDDGGAACNSVDSGSSFDSSSSSDSGSCPFD